MWKAWHTYYFYFEIIVPSRHSSSEKFAFLRAKWDVAHVIFVHWCGFSGKKYFGSSGEWNGAGISFKPEGILPSGRGGGDQAGGKGNTFFCGFCGIFFCVFLLLTIYRFLLEKIFGNEKFLAFFYPKTKSSVNFCSAVFSFVVRKLHVFVKNENLPWRSWKFFKSSPKGSVHPRGRTKGFDAVCIFLTFFCIFFLPCSCEKFWPPWPGSSHLDD